MKDIIPIEYIANSAYRTSGLPLYLVGYFYMKKGQYKKCPHCGKEFYVTPKQVEKRKYCSYTCVGEASRNRLKLKCKECGKEYERPVSQVRWRGTGYCSIECKNIAATKKCGPLSPAWKGKRQEKRRIKKGSEWKQWRELVFKRDNYTCQICGIRSGRDTEYKVELHPHHIKSYSEFPELRFDVSNGQTLCSSCHYALHGNLNKGIVRIKKHKPTIKTCPGCNELFVANRPDKFLCSHRCQERMRRKRMNDAKTCK